MQDVVWANSEICSDPTRSSINTLQVQSGFKSMTPEVHHEFLVTSFIKGIIDHLGLGSVGEIRGRQSLVVEGMQLDLRFDKKRKYPSGNVVVDCVLSSKKHRWEYEAVISADGTITLRKPTKKASRTKNDANPPSIEELKNPNLSFLASISKYIQVKELDYLVIGGGVAGLSCVAGLCQKDKDASIVVISKGAHGQSSATQYAQGGAAVCLSDEDSPQLHAKDTLVAGDGLCSPAAARILATETPIRVRELMAWGGEFDKEADGSIMLGRESGSSVKRIIHSKGAQTGEEIERTLAKKVMELSKKNRKNIQIDENVFIIDLLIKDGRCVGALGLNHVTGKYILYRAKATALATGGVSRIYRRNTNPKFSTGDGTALAYRAGANLANMEMIQFHPTALSIIDEEGRAFLISERVRGDGARLMNINGEYFMEKYHPAKEMAPRNVVARAVYWEMQKTKSDFVYLDTTPIKDFKTRFPKLYEECKMRGINLDKSPLIPVAPASHFAVGGILTDLNGRTTLQGLYAMGEVAYTGVHGADRMASNSLDEGLVFGRRASDSMIYYTKSPLCEELKGGDLSEKMPTISIGEEPDKIFDDIGNELDQIMQERVYLIRNKKDLEAALADVKKLREKFFKAKCGSLKDLELRNKLENAEIIITNALNREESRGAHFRNDYQEKGAGKWQIFSKKGLEKRDLEINRDDMAWLFRLPRDKKRFFGLDEEIVKNHNIYNKALKDEAVFFEIPLSSIGAISGETPISKLSEALKKEGYKTAASPEDLNSGEYFISVVNTKDNGVSALKLYIKLLLNSSASRGIDDVSGPSHRFPAWICRILASRLPAMIGKDETKFLLKNKSISFTGIINDIPSKLRNSLKPKQYPDSVIIYEGAISAVASIFKEILPKYYDVPLERIEEELRQAIIYYHKVKLWIRDSGVDFGELKKDILATYGERSASDSKFSALMRGIKRQYGYKAKAEKTFLWELATQFITEAVRFNKLPQIIDDSGKEINIDPVLAKKILDFITENGLVPESEIREKEIMSIAALIEGKQMKEKVSKKTEELFSYLRTTYTSPENEKSFYNRVKAAANKAEALEQGRRVYFQDEDAFRIRNRRPLSIESFNKLAAMYEQVNSKYAGLIYAVLGFMDVGKLVEFKNDPKYADLNFANHPEAGSYILKDKKTFQELGLSVDAEELALALVKQHGFIGQSKRGEVTDEVFEPILQLAIERKDPDILKLYLLINIIDTSVVSEGIFTEEFFGWFFNKYLQLEQLVRKGIREKKNAAEILSGEKNELLTDDTKVADYALERLRGIRPESTKDDINEAVERVFDGLPQAKRSFFTLLSRQRNSFSFWYPETALSWLKSIDSEVKFIYLLLQIADLKCKPSDMPIDINLYDIAKEVLRRDESRLSEENRLYIEDVIAAFDISKLIKSSEIERIFDYGLGGLNFEFDENNNAIYAGFDAFAPLGLSLTQAETRIEELGSIVDSVTQDNPIHFIEKRDIKGPKKVGVFAISGDPIQKSHKLLIEKALNEYNLDEIVLIVTKEHIIKDQFGATLAQRLFMLEQGTKDLGKVSIAVSQSGKFVKMAKAMKSAYPQGTLYFIMGFDNFEQMLDEDKSGNTRQDLENFFGRNRLLVAPRGYYTSKDINRILIERKMVEFSRFVYPLVLPFDNRFDSSTEARRLIRENVPENKLLSPTVIRIIKAFGLYKQKEKSKEELKVFGDTPTKIVFVNLTSPRHRVISEPQGINAMIGDLRKTFGQEVIVSAIDTQFGMKPQEAIEELIRREPDIIALSAQLESNKLLYEFLELISHEQSFKKKRVLTVVGNNLPTNENKGILTRYPFIITVRGEGELAGREIVRYMRGEISISDIPAASYVRNGKIIENDGVPITVSDLGIPARDNLVDILKHGGDIWIETSRGCGWGQCAFCFKDPFRAHKWEPYPDNVVIEGLEYLYKMGARHVSLTDPESFGGGKETLRGIRRARRIAEEMIKRGIKLKIAFSCRADSVYKKSDPEDIAREKIATFELLRKAGFESAFVGIESGSNKQLMQDFNKGITVEENEMAIKLLRGMGFEICAGFIPLDPYATLQTLQENVDFVRRNNLYLEISFPLNQLKVQPNTRYYTRTLADGLLGERRDTLHTYNCRYKDSDVQKIADVINSYGREVGSVFYVLKYMHRTENLNRIAEEDFERGTLKHFFIEYNRMEIDFLEALTNTVRDVKKLHSTINEFRKRRLNLALQVEGKIKDGTIKDRNNTLKNEIEKIRPLLNDFITGKLTDVPVETLTPPAAKEENVASKINAILKDGYPRSLEALKKLAVYADMIKEDDKLAELFDIPAAEIARRLELFIEISDDLKTITLYKVLDDSRAYSAGGDVDYSKLKLESIASFPSNNLVFPDNYIAKHFSGPTLSRILILFIRGGKYTKYGGIITNHDSRVDLDVWSTNIDTVYMHKIIRESGVLNRSDIKTAAEIGVGGGHLSSALVQNLGKLKNLAITDISIYALMAAKRNISLFAKKRDIKLRTFLGKGIKGLDNNLDLLLVNPPYVPVPPWERAEGSSIDDPYKGTGLIREIIAEGIDHLNPDNPDASIIMNYSSLATEDFEEYLRAYGKLVDVEALAQGLEVPLKIERVDERWLDWMEGKGLIIKKDVPEDGFKYWHTLNVVQIKPKKASLLYKDGRKSEPTALHSLKLKVEDATKWNSLTLSSKLMILALLRLDPKDYLWFDDEWRALYQVVKYYRENLGRFKAIIEKQLNRKVSIDDTDLLQSFYSPEDGFFCSNIIRQLYFTGKNPHVLPDAIQTLRGFVNKSHETIKKTLLDLFRENLKYFSWDKGIAEYIRQEYGYSGSFAITNITDFSIGTGVYKVRICLNDIPGKPEIEVFFKRQHLNTIDLRNEISYLNCEKLFLEDAMVDRLPFYYKNEISGKPDLLIAPVIKGRSLDSELSSSVLSMGQWEKRMSKLDIQNELIFAPRTDTALKTELINAFGKIKDGHTTPNARIKALKIIAKNTQFIKRGLALEGLVDFHCHTIFSDGKDTPAYVVLKAWFNGLRTIAIVDHISLCGISEAMRAAQALGGIEVMPGIEFYSNEKELNMKKLHVVAYFPAVKTIENFRNFASHIKNDPLFRKMKNVLECRTRNINRIRKRFNQMFEKDGLEISDFDIASQPQRIITLYEMARILFVKYGAEKLGVQSVAEAKEKYINTARHRVFPDGISKMELKEIFEMAQKFGGVVSLAHPLRNAPANKSHRIAKVKELLKKYATVQIGQDVYPGFQAMGIYGGGIGTEDTMRLREMSKLLSREVSIYNNMPIILLNESDYHGTASREILLGERDSAGYYSVPLQVASYSKVLDLRARVGLSSGAKVLPRNEEFVHKITLLLARHAALGDILGRNDRNLSNTRILSDATWGIENIVDFDISNMLDNDAKGEDQWYLNYDWTIEDVKQGLSEIVSLTLLKEYEIDMAGKNQAERLKTRSELIGLWKEEYLKKWREVTLPENVKKVEDIIGSVYAGTPDVVSRKIGVLERWIKTDPEKFLIKIFTALLIDYEKRRVYLDYLNRVKEKTSIDTVGYLGKYLTPSPDSFLSSKLEAFRGILSEDFLRRRRITGRKSIEEVFRDIESLVSMHMGNKEKEKLKKEVLRIRREANHILKEHCTSVSSDETKAELYNTAVSAGDAPIMRDLVKADQLAQGMVEMFYSFGFSGKKLALAFSKNIKSKEALRVVETLNKIKESPSINAKLKKILDNVILLPDVGSEGDLVTKLNAQGINIDEKDVKGDTKNILALFVPKDEQETFTVLDRKENVFSSYIDENKEEYNLAYYPLPEIVTITLSNILDKLAGIDRLIKQEDVITEIILENATIQLSDINIEKIRREGSRSLIFILLSKITRYDFGLRRDRYALTEELIKAAA